MRGVALRRRSPERGGEARGAELATSFLVFLLVLAFYYSWYRYPFQINSARTSPTYIDTPVALKTAKFGIFLVGLAYFWLKSADFLAARWTAFELFLLTFLVYFVLQATFLGLYFEAQEFVLYGAFWLAPLPILFAPTARLSYARLYRCIHWFLITAIAVDVVQAGLFLAFDRLPALAYQDLVSVRFGSIWDDPNSFGLVQAALIPFVLFGAYGRLMKGLLLGLALLCLVLTQSVSGLAATAAAVVAVVAVRWGDHLGRLSLLIFGVLTVGFLLRELANMSVIRDLLDAMWEAKSESREIHLQMISDMLPVRWLGYLGFDPTVEFGEDAYGDMLNNFGLPTLLLFLAIIGVAMAHLARGARRLVNPKARAVSCAGLGFLVGFVVGNFGIPFGHIFPTDLLMVTWVVIATRIGRETAAETVRLRRLPGVVARAP